MSAIVMRKIQQRWRRSCWPLVAVCTAREHGVAYERAFQALKDELVRRGIPLPGQINLDWFPGSSAAAKKVFPSIWVCQGLWHQRRNLLKNHTAGRRARAAQADGLPKKKTKRGRVKKTPPHLQSRPIYAFLNLTSRLVMMPSKAMFHLCCEKIFARIEHVWNDGKWLQYYKSEYMSTRPAQSPEAEGRSEFFHASWWSGLGSQLLPGRPATQQPVEMLHSHFKRAMRSQRLLDSHLAVVMSLEETVGAWSGPLSPCEMNRKKLVSLMAPDALLSMGRPRDPDQWMLTTGISRRAPFGKLKFYPPITPLLKRFKKKNSPFIEEVTTPQKDKSEQKWLPGGCREAALF